jgi:hypothetical protein
MTAAVGVQPSTAPDAPVLADTAWKDQLPKFSGADAAYKQAMAMME